MRLIDKDKLIESIKQAFELNMEGAILSASDMVEAIDQAPTVDTWHYPSKGEYPPEEGFYLVTIETPEGRARFVSMLNYSATLENPRRRWIDCMGLEETRIVAWMPLPDPPKEEA